MPNGAAALQLIKEGVIKDIRHEPHALMRKDLHVPGNGNAGAFLPPVLQGKEGKEGKTSDILIRGIYSKNAACFVQINYSLTKL